MQVQHPRIGVGVIIIKDKCVLLGKRKNSHGEGSWAFPGGHLEYGESPEECAVRETLEETGIEINNIRKGPFTNDFFAKEGKHYITLFMLADHVRGDPEIKEPHKCEEWRWFNWDALPEPLFLSLKNLKQQKFRPA